MAVILKLRSGAGAPGKTASRVNKRVMIKNLSEMREGVEAASGGDLEQFFDVFFGSSRPPLMHSEIGWHPAADMYETETHFVVVIDIAGISPKDVSLVLDHNALILRGVRRESAVDERRQYHKMEVPYGPFERVFRLVSPVNGDRVSAVYKDGFLFIRLEKRAKSTKKRTTITIR